MCSISSAFSMTSGFIKHKVRSTFTTGDSILFVAITTLLCSNLFVRSFSFRSYANVHKFITRMVSCLLKCFTDDQSPSSCLCSVCMYVLSMVVSRSQTAFPTHTQKKKKGGGGGGGGSGHARLYVQYARLHQYFRIT